MLLAAMAFVVVVLAAGQAPALLAAIALAALLLGAILGVLPLGPRRR